MDKSKLFIDDETDAQNKSEKKSEIENEKVCVTQDEIENEKICVTQDEIENEKICVRQDEIENENKLCVTKAETENENKLQKQELYASNDGQKSDVEFEPKLKSICKEKEKYPECGLKKDQAESPHRRTTELSETNRSRFAIGIAHKVTDQVDYSSSNKNIYVRKIMQKYLRIARTNPTGTIKKFRYIRRDGKTQKTMTAKSISPQTLTKKQIYVSQTDKCIEISKECISQTKINGFEDAKSEVTNIGKTKPKTDKLQKLKTNPSAMHRLKSHSEDLSKDVTVVPSSSQSASTTSYESEMISRSSEVKSAEEVLTHFKWFMHSKKESFDKSMAEYSCKQDMKEISESESRRLKYPPKTRDNIIIQGLKKNLLKMQWDLK
ncbi:hypothetical protein HNY73_007287 [Argiope bruennichi]|uniref:Uncharacterized protein n=1 Tax=Argiope bruennichi TaxID=94029 RepID=A0A8T0FE03_ARGBR|nr:hypothetical protein HNY73_007287 [Argiope bruennichi]